jgi:hypothetical protein
MKLPESEPDFFLSKICNSFASLNNIVPVKNCIFMSMRFVVLRDRAILPEFAPKQ